MLCPRTIPTGQATGSYYIGAFADPTNVVVEEFDTNNGDGADPVTIVAVGQPDLQVMQVGCPATVKRGALLACPTTIWNAGSARAAASVAELRLSTNNTITSSDTLLGACSVGALVPGQSQTVTCSGLVPPTTATGVRYGGIIADSSKVVSESNENNNTGFSPVLVQ